ncbi:G-protein coupled receptor 143-like [Onthophagus taurus]|uniref:G-protein coupled receptor 143-like n=1 Tax=Onthophagus taurus TaxID=166361 RepID=UPI000C20707F|nr:G-protein coupled receptor 143-like [Onthophagus taurus]
MADPTIQTFCCHHVNGSDMALLVMKSLNTTAYNAITILSSTLGVLGALYQILPREQYVYNHKWISITAIRGRKIIVWLAFSDLLASLGVLVRASHWITYRSIMPCLNDKTSVLFCAICSAVAQYFYTSTWVWTICYTIDMKLLLLEKKSPRIYYHLAAWIIPIFLTTIGLGLLYIPNGECHTRENVSFKILPNFLVTYVPITIVMIVNPILYSLSTKDMETVIATISGQFTSKEREVMDAIKRKFFYINLAFVLCWAPNLINGVFIWSSWFHIPSKIIIILWYLMAVMNPLQALFNCIVYRRWTKGAEKIVKPWNCFKQLSFSRVHLIKSHSSSSLTTEETLPLLENLPRTRVSYYSN